MLHPRLRPHVYLGFSLISQVLLLLGVHCFSGGLLSLFSELLLVAASPFSDSGAGFSFTLSFEICLSFSVRFVLPFSLCCYTFFSLYFFSSSSDVYPASSFHLFTCACISCHLINSPCFPSSARFSFSACRASSRILLYRPKRLAS